MSINSSYCIISEKKSRPASRNAWMLCRQH